MKVLNKKLFRVIVATRGQSVAVAAVVLCGAACYISVASAHRNLKLTRDTYYSHYRFADFEIHLERAPQTAVFKIEALPGVHSARGRIVKDVNVDVAGQDEPRTGRLVSMPNRQEQVIDDICLMEGRYFSPGVLNEVILSARFARENNLQVGDSIQASIDSRKHSLRVVGLALSPEYVYMIRGAQDLLPSPGRFGILWVPQDFAETALDMKAACNNIVGLADNRQSLALILHQAEKVLDPYGVYAKTKRSDQISNRFLSDEIDGLAVTARVVPTVFQLIAALIILVLLNRMVRKERTEIGLLKAFGYSNTAIAAHYIKYALLLSIAGCMGGFLLGQWMSSGMVRMYVDFFEFPLLRSRVYPEVLVRSLGSSIAFAILGAVMAVVHAVRINPAESMRPEAPRFARRTLLERWGLLWQRLSFTNKMIARNISRNPFRAALNIFGVMVSSGLLIMGYFSVDSMDFMIRFQYESAQREDVKIAFESERSRQALYESSRFDFVRHAEPLLEYPFEVQGRWRKKEVLITGLPRHARLQKLIDTRMNPVDIGGHGLVLSEFLADALGVAAGDVVTIKPLMGRIAKSKQVVVSKVVTQYLGASAYMNLDALSRILDEPFVMNAALLTIESGKERALNKHLKDVPGIAAVAIKEDARRSLQDTIQQSMSIMTTMTILFGAVIACSIIYNVTTVSLAERQRELASLRVLGFSTSEVGRILFHENLALGAIGLVLGIPFGIGVSRLIVEAYDTELYRMPFHIEPRTYGIATLLSVLFVTLANLAVRHKIHRLDMVDVLKERE